MRSLLAFFTTITAPHPSLDRWAGRRARVLSVGALWVLLIGLPVSTTILVVSPEDFQGSPLLAYACYALVAVVYAAARSRLYATVMRLVLPLSAIGFWIMLSSAQHLPAMLSGMVLTVLPFAFAAFALDRWAPGVVIFAWAAGAAALLWSTPFNTELLWFSILATGLVGGAMVGIQILFRADREDLVAQHAELEQAWSAALVAEEARSRFLAAVHHELRTPLHGVMSASELLLEETGPDARDLVLALRQSAVRLNSLVDEVLHFVDASSGYFELELETVDVSRLVTEIFQDRGASLRDALTLQVEPELVVSSDAARLGQLLALMVGVGDQFADRVAIYAMRTPDGVRLAVEIDGPDLGPHLFGAEGGELLRRREGGHDLGLTLSTALAFARILDAELDAVLLPTGASQLRLTLGAGCEGQRRAA